MKYIIYHPQQETLNKLDIVPDNNVSLLCSMFENLNHNGMDEQKAAIVAAGNSFGIMDGGLDEVMLKFYGMELQSSIQKVIAERFFGELTIGCAVVAFPKANHYPAIVYAPTMQVPMTIIGTVNVYYATLAAIRTAKDCGCETVYLPLLGAGAGKMPIEDVGTQMLAAILESIATCNPYEITWDYAMRKHALWHELIGMPEQEDV